MVYILNLHSKYNKIKAPKNVSGAGVAIDKEKELQEKNTVIQHVAKENLKPKLPEYGKPIPKTNPEIDEASKAKLRKFVSFKFT